MRPKRSIYLCLFTILCMGFVILPGALAETPDYPDNCPSTQDVALNSSVNGHIDPGRILPYVPGDDDVFRITVPSAGTLTIYTSSSGWFDNEGKLMDAGCGTIAEHNNIDWPWNPNFEIVQPVSAGTYYIEVEATNMFFQGDYTLHVEFDGGVSNHTITASAGAGGSITPSGTVSVPDGGSQAFSITPDACYVVDDVVVDGVSKGAQSSWTFTNVTEDHTISASFASTGSLTITASAESNGSISPSGAVSVSCGANQSFTITPDGGYEILDVIVDGVSKGAQTSWSFNNVTADHTISASFGALADFTINTIAGANGSISPAGPVAVPAGGSQSFSIIPDTGYQVHEVWIDGGSIGAVSSYTFTNVNTDHSIEAQFEFASDPPPPGGCLDISDTPLDARFRAAPANIMFLLDDSGSMDWEFMTSEDDGTFQNYEYVFDDPGERTPYSRR